MTSEFIFVSLSKTLFQSCLQGFGIWALTRLVLLLIPSASAATRYRIFYGAFTLTFFGFAGSLCYHLFQSQSLVSLAAGGANVTASRASVTAGLVSWFRTGEYLAGTYSRWISVCYILGLIFHAVNLLSARLQLLNLSRQRSEQRDSWQDRLTPLRVRLGITGNVGLYFTSLYDVPFTTGFARPLIYFPLAALNHLSVEQVEALLLHELAHIRRNDYLFNMIQQVMKGFLFFNPFALMLNRAICREREFCCDDLVVDHQVNQVSYANALLRLEEFRSIAPSLSLASTGNSKYPLLNRIKRMIMTSQKPSPMQRVAVLTFGAAALLSLAFVVPTEPEAISAAPNITSVQRLKNVRPATKAPNLSLSQPALIVAQLPADTIPAKKKVKIVVEDEKGNKKEYRSLAELPDSLRREMGVPRFGEIFDEADLKKQQAEFKAMFDSPEWKKNMEKLENLHNSPEWKIQQEKLSKYFESPEWKVQTEKIEKYFTSPEWKAQTEKLMKYTESDEFKKYTEEAQKHGEKMQQYFSSPEWQGHQKKLQETLNENFKYMERHGDEMNERKKVLEKQKKELEKELKELEKQIDKKHKEKPGKTKG